MTALTSLSDLVNKLTGGNSGTPENIFFFKNPYISNTQDTWAAGFMYSCWKYDGFPNSGANPTTVAAPTSSTQGAIPYTNASGGRVKFMPQIQAMASLPDNINGILLYDRLLHIGGLDGTVTTAQTVGGSLTRNTGGVGNQIWVEIYTAVGTTARTITASYTNQSGTASRTTTAVTFGGTVPTLGNDANLIIPLPLQSGDTGVQSVQSVTISATTGTAGNFGVTIVKPIAWLSTRGFPSDFTVGPAGMPSLEESSCLALALIANTTVEAGFFGMMATVES